MIRIFVDSSVLFAAAYSATGHSRDLILMAAREEITLVISHLVLAETRRNLFESAPEVLNYLDLVIDNIPFESIQPTKREVIAASEFVVLKDAPIVAAAKKAGVKFLVTLDRKHLLGKPKIAQYAGVDIVTPKEAVTVLRKLT
ncbi:MAG: PIN domain-containing protein [Anaerolineales bacterium]|jgi:predicted nucleic acid-binding protein